MIPYPGVRVTEHPPSIRSSVLAKSYGVGEPMWATDLVDAVVSYSGDEAGPGSSSENVNRVIESVMATALLMQVEMRGIPLRREELSRLSHSVPPCVLNDGYPGEVKVTSTNKWLRDVDSFLNNRRCTRCGSLAAAMLHTSEDCDLVLAGDVMDT